MMKILFYSDRPYEQPFLIRSNKAGHDIHFTTESLSSQNTSMASGFDAVSVFTGDDCSAALLQELHSQGVQYLVTRSAGVDHIDIDAAKKLGIRVANVPAYSPHAIAEHGIAMMLALTRKLILADNQVHQQDFRLDNLVGFNLHHKTVGLIGTGKIGAITAKILHGFGCQLLAYDIHPDESLTEKYGVVFTTLAELCAAADIISLHTPLNPSTKYLVNDALISTMKDGVMIINTARGAVVNTTAIIHGLTTGKIGFYGMDVYEKEKGVFFYDHGGEDLHDVQLEQLLSMNNVLLTPHQAFATTEALGSIAQSCFQHFDAWDRGQQAQFEL
ncbi:MAG: 2-hydroxyacid dehydrogenase [Ferruginibacter sp.]|nr:2-hydroxyacid dehydrogenase [Ferruginibacter sp.]